MSAATSPIASAPITAMDGRQSQAAIAIARGTRRHLGALGFASLDEVTLPNGRRADLVGLGATGEVWIVEIKSSIEDFRADQKWPEYREYCDRLLFAVAADFPREVLPDDVGCMIADRFGAELLRQAPEHKLASARRKVITGLFARVAALRLQALTDPEARLERPIG